MHRATRFIEVVEERVAMAKKHVLPKALMSKDKPHDDYYEPHRYYDKDYQKDDRGKKAATYYVSNGQPELPWNKYFQNDEVQNSQPLCDFHKRPGHNSSQCHHLQEFLFSKYLKGKIKK